MKLSRFFKTIFMTDFVGGLLIAIRELFKSKKTINYPFEKGKISPRFRGVSVEFVIVINSVLILKESPSFVALSKRLSETEVVDNLKSLSTLFSVGYSLQRRTKLSVAYLVSSEEVSQSEQSESNLPVDFG